MTRGIAPVEPRRLITHAEYMADSARLHQRYFLEIAEAIPDLEAWILDHWTLDELRTAYAEDSHLNNLPVPKGFIKGIRSPLGDTDTPWLVCMDKIFLHFRPAIARVIAAKREQRGFGASFSDNVCAIKAMMRDMVERADEAEKGANE